MLDLETFLTTLYVMLDDFCQSQPPPPAHPGPAPALAPSEVATLALLQQWSWYAGERDFYRWSQRHLRAAFPTLPHRSQFNRLLRQQHALLTAFALHLAARLSRPADVYEVLDGTAAPVRNNARRGRGWLPGQADRGKSSRLGWFVGFRVLVVVRPDGVITGFGFGAASTSEYHRAETLFAARHRQDPALASAGRATGRCYVGDKGFWGDRPQARWWREYRVELVAPPYANAKRPWPRPWHRWLAGKRQIVETVIAKLESHFRLDKERPHALSGFATRLAAKVGLHNFCIWLNQQRGRPKLAFAELLGW